MFEIPPFFRIAQTEPQGLFKRRRWMLLDVHNGVYAFADKNSHDQIQAMVQVAYQNGFRHGQSNPFAVDSKLEYKPQSPPLGLVWLGKESKP